MHQSLFIPLGPQAGGLSSPSAQRPPARVPSLLAILLILLVWVAPGTAQVPLLQTNHGAGISKQLTVLARPGDNRVHVGDLVTVEMRITHQDGVYSNIFSSPLPGGYLAPLQARDWLRFNRLYDVTHYPPPTGNVTNEITFPSPGYVVLTNLADRRNFELRPGSFIKTNYTFAVLPDAAKTNILFDDAITEGVDLHNFWTNIVGAPAEVPQNFILTFPNQLRVLAPCIRVFNTCLSSSNGIAQFSGSVSNCGNTPLLNVVVSNLYGGAFTLVFGPTNLSNNQVFTFTGTYLYNTNDPVPPSNTLVAYGTDELDLTVSSSATATCRPCLGDFVWQDRNGNGLQDAGEPGVSNVTVTLRDCDTGALIRQTLTDANGKYLFCELLPANYRIEISVPTGYSLTASNVGPDDCRDSDAVTRIGSNVWSTACLTFLGNTNNLCVDFGLKPLGAIGDFVWEDLNANGIQDAGEPGVANVTVFLLNCAGQLIASTNTGPSGLYLFPCLAPDSYRVQFSPPAGYRFTLQNAGADDTRDSDADATGLTACTNLALGQTNLTIDAGLVRNPCLGDFVWEDRNGDGLQDPGEPGISNVVLRLQDCSSGAFIRQTNTGPNGQYLFCDLPPGNYRVEVTLPSGYSLTASNVGPNDCVDSDASIPVSPTVWTTTCYTMTSGTNNLCVDIGLRPLGAIGDFVWEDLNGNGLQDAGEPGIPNVTVQLLNCSNQVIAATNTDVNGAYLFTHLPASNYVVRFIAPSGYVFTLPNVGANDGIDSDANSSGFTSCTPLALGETNRTLDAGLVRPACLGDLVWEDRNGDGIQDAGEPGIPNVQVRVQDCSTGLFLGQTNTGPNGQYLFCNLAPGSYRVEVTLPFGYGVTRSNTPPDDCLDSDAVTNTAANVWLTQCAPLTSGTNNLCVDIGFKPLGAIGDRVWSDINKNGLQDGGEPGVPGIPVQLYNCNNQLIATTTTDADGLYLFACLPASNYVVRFLPPSGYQFTTPNVGSNDAIDSDADSNGFAPCTTITLGQTNRTVDAGLIPICPPYQLVCAPNQSFECSGFTAATNLFTPPSVVGGLGVVVTVLTNEVSTNTICPGKYTVTRVWRAVDACTNVQLCSQILTIVDTTPPNITCGDNQIVECNQPWSFTLPYAVDGCDSTNVIIRMLSTVTNVATPRCPNLFSVVRTWSASDACGNSNVCSQTITVIDTTPPNITCADNRTVECNQPWNFTAPYAVDACEGTNVTIRVVSTVTNAASPRCPNLLSAVRTWSASDSCGNSNLCSQTITVIDTTPPTLTCAANQTVECGQPWNFTAPYAVDACEGTNVTVRILSTVTNAANPRCPNLFSVVRTWSASDSCGNSNTCSQSITVVDTVPPVVTCVGNQTVECGQPWAFTAPYAVDACDGSNVTVRILSTVTNAANPRCPTLFSVVRIWSASDSCGNSNTCSQSITVVDTVPPNITCGDDRVVECNQPFTFTAPYAVDACEGTNLTIRVLSTTTNAANPRCPNQLNIVRTWSASDSCGNSNVCSQTITIVDTLPPVITCAANQTVECGQPWAFSAPYAVDACDGSNVTVRILSTVTNAANPRCPNLFSVVRTWSASDSCGNSNTCSQSITVVDTVPPVVTCVGNQTVECGQPWAFSAPYAVDACEGTNVTVRILSTVTNAANPRCPTLFSVVRTWSASDSCGNSNVCSQSITVVDTVPPVVTCVGNQTVECGQPFAFSAPYAVDACEGSNVTVRILSTVTNAANPRCPNLFSVVRTWSASDSCGNSNTCSQSITVVDTVPPVVTCAASRVVECNQPFTFTAPYAVDACDGTNVTIRVLSTTTNVATPRCPNQLNIVRTWSASDSCGNSNVCSQTITIVDTLPPVITCAANQTVECGQPWAFTAPYAVDACDGSNVTVRILSTVTNVASPRCPSLFSVTRTWSASDSCGNSNTCSQSITVVDTAPPVVTCVGNQTVECGQPWAFSAPYAVDACEGTNVTVRILSTVTNAANPRCPTLFSVVRTWSASDSCGNSNTCSQSITVVDTVPPVVTCVGNQTVECGQPWAFSAPYAVDACEGTNVTVRILSTVTNAANPRCPTLFSVVRTWSASDSCGNSNTCSQSITVVDTVPPNITCADNRILECNQPWGEFTRPYAVDACDGTNVTIRILGTVTNGLNPRCPNVFNITRTWSASDTCGNSNICSQTITLVDTTPPNITCVDNQIVECNQPWSFLPPYAVDACEGTNVVIRLLNTVTNAASPRCPSLFSVVRTWSASDSCGNSNVCSQTITVIDTTPPNITCGNNQLVECGQHWTFTPPYAVDACEGTNVTIRVLSTVTNTPNPRCPNLISVVRTWSASDSCGNSNVCAQSVTVVDTLPPEVICRRDKVVECGIPWSFDPPSASDTCEGLISSLAVVGQDVTNRPSMVCLSSYSVTRTWRATDSCSNSATCSQTVLVVDSTPPVLNCSPNRVVECGLPIAFTPPSASDLCSGTNVAITTVSTVTNPVACGVAVTRTWSASDACGNVSSCSQTLVVIDTLPPVLTGVPGDATVRCLSDVPPPGGVGAYDLCDTSVTITVTRITNGACPTVIRTTWTASDDCSNTVSQTQFITVQPLPPVINVPPADVTTCVGSNATFCVSAVNACPLTYQWLFNGILLPGQTNACLTVNNVSPSQAGRYCVVVANGCYAITNCADLVLRGSIGDYVWNDLNADGCQNMGEPGLSNIVVELWTCNGQAPLRTTLTDAAGYYRFDCVEAGNYKVRFQAPSPSWQFTAKNNPACGTAADSDANASGVTDCFNLPPGGSDLTRDAGLRLVPRCLDVTEWVACYLPGDACGVFGETAQGYSSGTNYPAFCYAITVSNCSSVALTNVMVVDSRFGDVTAQFFPNKLTPLNPGQSITRYWKLAVDQDVTNVVNATGNSVVDGLPVAATDSVATYVDPATLTCRSVVYSPADTDGSFTDNRVTLPGDGLTYPVSFIIEVCNTSETVNFANVRVRTPGLGLLTDCPEVFTFSLASNSCRTQIICTVELSCDQVPLSLTNLITAEVDTSNGRCGYDLRGSNIVVQSVGACTMEVACEAPNACRVTGGGRQETSFPAVRYVTHGGQVGAPVGSGINFGTFQREGNPCIHGNWEHVRHEKGGTRGNFHAKIFDSIQCACLGCPENPGSGVVVNGLCNPDDRICGPEPRRAPGNKICFSGIGDYASSSGSRTPRSVLFRVDIEDRSEPGNNSAGGNKPPPDRHRIRIWILTPAEVARLNNPSDRLLSMRQAIACTTGTTVLQDGAVGSDGKAVPLGTAVFGLRAPDVDDGGEMDHGNHQIHPMIKKCP